MVLYIHIDAVLLSPCVYDLIHVSSPCMFNNVIWAGVHDCCMRKYIQMWALAHTHTH